MITQEELTRMLTELEARPNRKLFLKLILTNLGKRFVLLVMICLEIY